MDLLERYLAAVARQLSDAQKADVTAELRDVLLSNIEDEEAQLGRPLTAAELERLLIHFGHPLTVAGRYRKIQHLIGPEVFPFWWAGVKAALAIVLGLYLVLLILAVVAGEDAATIGDRAAPSLTASLVFAFGAVTLVCALIERFGKTALLTRWTPRDLPPATGKRRSRFEIVVDIGAELVFILWWIGALQFRSFVPEWGPQLELAPVWAAAFWPILVFSAYELVANLVALWRPGRVRLVEALRLGRSLAGAAILGWVYQAGHWVEVSSDSMTPAALASVQSGFDLGLKVAIVGTTLVYLAMAGAGVWRIRQAVASAQRPTARGA